MWWWLSPALECGASTRAEITATRCLVTRRPEWRRAVVDSTCIPPSQTPFLEPVKIRASTIDPRNEASNPVRSWVVRAYEQTRGAISNSFGVHVARSNAAPLAEDETPCAERNCLLASVVLVDSRGWLLLQERDEHALVAPNQWGLVGGHLKSGEEWEAALYRELLEETGLRPDGGLELWFDEYVQHSPKISTHLADHWRIWAGKVDLRDEDITVGEGRQIVFVDPARITDGSLNLAVATAYVLPLFLESETYRRMR